MGCLGLRLLNEAGLAQVGLGSSLAPGAARAPLTASPEDPEPQASRGGECGGVQGPELSSYKPHPLGLARGHTSPMHLAVARAVAYPLPGPSPRPVPRVRGGVA